MTFDQIYGTYWDKVYRLCMGYVNDRALAQDMAQETFVAVWQQLPKFRGESSLGTWIFRIACNKCLRQIERNSRFVKQTWPEELEDKVAPSQEREVQYLYQCISQLNETDRLIISLELEDIRQAEIAGILGISESNVRVRIHRIKEKLTLKFKSYER